MRHLLTVVCLLLTAGLALSASASAYALERAERDIPRGVESGIKADQNGVVRVFITLKDQPALAAMQRHERLQRKILGIGAQPVAQAKDGKATAYITDRERSVGAWRIEQRESAIERANRYLVAPLAQVEALQAEIERVGGKLLEARAAPAGVLALLPSGALGRIAGLSYVQAVQPQPKEKPLLNKSVPSTKAPTWWASGYNGGTGGQEVGPVNVGISTEDVEIGHAWFGTLLGQTPPGYVNYQGAHGTKVASVILSEDTTYKGVAYGMNKVNYGWVAQAYCGGISDYIWHLGGTQYCTNNDNTLPGASDPIEVENFSAGTVPQTDTTSSSNAADDGVYTYSVPLVPGAGNSPGANKVHDPCIGYNTTCVSGIDHMDTPAVSSDDEVVNYSSNGPTIGGRKKPDISAPAGSGARPLWVADYLGGGDWETGTSLAAPHVTGAYALLIGAGIPGLPAKAVLINSASPISGQSDGVWNAGAGWGELDLERAFNWRSNWAASTVQGGKAKFFQLSNVVAGDKTTLTWYRRSYKPAQNLEPVIHTLTNLDLSLYDPSQNQLVSSASAIDNVELIKHSGANQATAYIKVDANSTVEGASSEPFAVAGSKSLTPVDGPTFDISTALSASQAKQSDQVTVTAQVANSGDLAASSATQVVLSLPAGVSLVQGAQTQSVGTLNPNQGGQASWTVQGSSDGLKQLSVTAEATGWDETFSFSDDMDLLVDSTGPTSTMGTLSQFSQSKTLNVSWAGTDAGVGIASYELEVRAGAGAWQGLGELTASQTSYTYTADDGQSYSFRVRGKDSLGNVGDWSQGQATTVDTTAPFLSLSPPTKKLYRYDTAQIGVNASDFASGIATKRYSVNGGAYQTFNGATASIFGMKVGQYSVEVEVLDGAGNSKKAQTSLAFHNKPLDPELKITKIWRKGKHVWIKGTIRPFAFGSIKLVVKRKKKGAFKALGKPVKAANKNGTYKAKLKLKKKAKYRFVASWPGNSSFLPGEVKKEKKV